MSFDFGSSQQEADPTADFLARERANAGALEGDADLFGGGPTDSLNNLQGHSQGDKDFESSASAFPALDGENQFGATPQEDDLLGGGDGATAAPPSAPSGNDERGEFESKFPQLDEDVEPEPAASQQATHIPESNGFMAPPVESHISRTAPEGGASSLGVSSDPYGLNDEEDTEPIRRWREEQEEEIARREANAERRKAETISKAEQDIDNFYAEYNKKKEKNISSNKEEEASFLAQRQAELAEGTTWSRVTKLVDLQNSQSKTIAKTGPGSTDLTRMKEVLLSLRREGETAPGAGGY